MNTYCGMGLLKKKEKINSLKISLKCSRAVLITCVRMLESKALKNLPSVMSKWLFQTPFVSMLVKFKILI